ncbi:MAG TPA: tetratricopeptide repeat protein [Candidatus Sulfotelmatobacter sp.]|nr:tetratricopeptide repeat protein [Candidatus Sulfotelmatobacter sp.]
MLFVFLLPMKMAAALPSPQAAAPSAQGVRNGASTAGSAAPAIENPALLFQRGQQALAQGRIEEAELDFRQVLQQDPQSGGAFANLGVVYMRRKQWARALQSLTKAEQLMPEVAGIRLNIGLAYYRQSEFLKATPPLESVVRDQPDAVQPRYLLGLCYFFAERWADAATTLEPLWPHESRHLPYLYVLSNAAHRAALKELDNRATEQLIKVGDGSPEYRMFVGKYYLNLDQYDLALTEFQAAATADPKLPFVHFNLGLTYLKKQDYQNARDEFLKDAAVEPDLALNYDELGNTYWLMQADDNAEKAYRQALRRDPRLVSSLLGLAKVYRRQQKFVAALAELDIAVNLDPARTDVHYVRGQVLQHMGRKVEAKKELEAAVNIDNEHRAAREKQMETIPSPELLQEPQ